MKKETSIKKGDFIRVKASDGTPIGCYMKIISTTAKGAYCVDQENKVYYVSKEKVIKATVITICMSERDFKRIVSPLFGGWYKHEATKLYDELEKMYDIVRIITNSGKKAYFTYESIRKTMVITDEALNKCDCYVNIYGINVIYK